MPFLICFGIAVGTQSMLASMSSFGKHLMTVIVTACVSMFLFWVLPVIDINEPSLGR